MGGDTTRTQGGRDTERTKREAVTGGDMQDPVRPRRTPPPSCGVTGAQGGGQVPGRTFFVTRPRPLDHGTEGYVPTAVQRNHSNSHDLRRIQRQASPESARRAKLRSVRGNDHFGTKQQDASVLAAGSSIHTRSISLRTRGGYTNAEKDYRSPGNTADPRRQTPAAGGTVRLGGVSDTRWQITWLIRTHITRGRLQMTYLAAILG